MIGPQRRIFRSVLPLPHDLRPTQAFPDSLAHIREEWRCHSVDALARALKDHVLLIYRELGQNKRSSTKLHPGRDVTIEVGSHLVPPFLSSVATSHSVSFVSPEFLVGAATTIKYVVSWLRQKSALRRDLKDIAKRIADASVDSSRKTSRLASGAGRPTSM
jgi:hypothetical protein